jgi:hypothetical protein
MSMQAAIMQPTRAAAVDSCLMSMDAEAVGSCMCSLDYELYACPVFLLIPFAFSNMQPT